MRVVARRLVVAVWLVAGVACSNAPNVSSSRDGSAQSSVAPSRAGSDAPSASRPASSGPRQGPVASASPKQANVRLPDGTPDHAPGTEKAPVTVQVGFPCLIAGTAQTVSITSEPELQVSYATLYADGSAHKEYGGQGVGLIPHTRTFTYTWTVPAKAPLGDVRTDVAVAGKINGKDSSAFAHAYWRVARTC